MTDNNNNQELIKIEKGKRSSFVFQGKIYTTTSFWQQNSVTFIAWKSFCEEHNYQFTEKDIEELLLSKNKPKNTDDKRLKRFTYHNKIYTVNAFLKEFDIPRARWFVATKKYGNALFKENNLDEVIAIKRKSFIVEGKQYGITRLSQIYGIGPHHIKKLAYKYRDAEKFEQNFLKLAESVKIHGKQIGRKTRKMYLYIDRKNKEKKRLSLSQLAKLSAEVGPIHPVTGKKGVPRTTISQRIEALGFTAYEAIHTPVRNINPIKREGDELE